MRILFIALVGLISMNAVAGFRPQFQDPDAATPLVRPTPNPPSTTYRPMGRPDLAYQRVESRQKKEFERTEFRKLPPPPTWNLKGQDPAKIRAFAEKARLMPLPEREYSLEVRARETVEKYADALKIVKHTPIRTTPDRGLLKVADVSDPPPPITFEIWTARLDSLFEILDAKFPTAVVRLWNLSFQQENPPEYQARDALFAGIGAQRASWNYTASMALERALNLKVTDRHWSLLWSAIHLLPSHLDVLYFAKLLKLKPGDPAPAAGDLIFFLLSRENEAFAAQVHEPRHIEQLKLEQALSNLAKGKIPEARIRLEQLLISSSGQVRSEAAINLARLHLKEGRASEALLTYGQVEKNGQNRLNLLLETSWAEFKSGEIQGSLGKAVALQSPYFRYGWAPEAFVLETLGRKSLCDFGGAQAALRRFQEEYSGELEFARYIAQTKKSNGTLYSEILSSFQSNEPRRIERLLLSLPETIAGQEFILGAGKELSLLRSLTSEKHAPPIPQDWDQFLSLHESHFAKRVIPLKERMEARWKQEASYQYAKLLDVFTRFDLIHLDVASRAANDFDLQSALNFPVASESIAPEKRGRMLWPYHQEVWEDEMDFLKVRGDGECANRFTASTPEVPETQPPAEEKKSAAPALESEGASEG